MKTILGFGFQKYWVQISLFVRCLFGYHCVYRLTDSKSEWGDLHFIIRNSFHCTRWLVGAFSKRVLTCIWRYHWGVNLWILLCVFCIYKFLSISYFIKYCWCVNIYKESFHFYYSTWEQFENTILSCNFLSYNWWNILFYN